MDIFGGLASLLSGGITGIIGAGIQKYADYKQMQEANRHAKEMKALDLQFLDREWEGKAKVAEIEGKSAEEVAKTKMQEASYEADKATYSSAPQSPWMIAVDTFRGAIRPLATVYFIILSSAVLYVSYKMVPESGLTQAQAYDILYYCVIWILYTAGMILGWWFGVRPSGSAPALPALRK